MRLILAGPPACGKGTQGDNLSDEFGIPSISIGGLLRSIPENHPRYEENKKIMNLGGLAPDELVAEVIEKRLRQDDCKEGYILDGYGRRLSQIRNFEPELDAVILIDISEEESIKRISGRRLCTTDGEIYNIYTLPKEELKKCQGDLVQRDDDKEEVVKVRFQKYRDETVDMLEYYKKKGMLYKIDGIGTPEEINERVKNVLRNLDLI
jgi:adenylate kinase